MKIVAAFLTFAAFAAAESFEVPFGEPEPTAPISEEHTGTTVDTDTTSTSSLNVIPGNTSPKTTSISEDADGVSTTTTSSPGDNVHLSEGVTPASTSSPGDNVDLSEDVSTTTTSSSGDNVHPSGGASEESSQNVQTEPVATTDVSRAASGSAAYAGLSTVAFILAAAASMQ